jgi:predicted HD phosphohydrolase
MNPGTTVSFSAMRHGTPADFDLIDANDTRTLRDLPDRVLAHLRLAVGDDGAYAIDRLQHMLQTATRAERDGADEEWVVAALLHDVGDLLAPCTHGQVAAEILRPFVREEIVWVVRHHGAFQRAYCTNRPASERAMREPYRAHPHYSAAVDFCEKWDQCSFDPDYDTLPLEHFEPRVRRVLGRAPFRAEVR